MHRRALKADVYIVDNKVMRSPSEPTLVQTEESLKARNPPATITAEAWEAISQAVSGNKTTKILIDGEEDLLTLPAIICAPIGTVVIYGQPREGVVAVKVTKSKKSEARRLIAAMPQEDR